MDNQIEWLESSLSRLSDRTGVSFYSLRSDAELCLVLFKDGYADARQYVLENYSEAE